MANSKRSKQKDSTSKAKLEVSSQEKQIQLWKQQFKNLLGNPPKVKNESITRIISKQLKLKLS